MASGRTFAPSAEGCGAISCWVRSKTETCSSFKG